MPTWQQPRTGAAIASATVVLIVGASLTRADRPAEREYAGRVLDGHPGRVRFSARYDGDRVRSVAFEAKRLEVSCDGGRTHRIELRRRPIRVRGSTFDYDLVYDAPSFGIEEYIRIHGELRRGNAARGFLLYHEGPHGQSSSECTTSGGLQRWKASTHGHGRRSGWAGSRAEDPATPPRSAPLPVAPLAPTHLDRRTEIVRFEGRVADHKSSVVVKLRLRGDRPVGGTFAADDISMACEREYRRVDLSPTAIQVDRGGLSLDRYRESASGVESYFRVAGSFAHNGNLLVGFLYGYRDSRRPASYCTSTITQGWSARRVRSRHRPR